MLTKLWRRYVSEPRRLRQCADCGFVANPEMDKLCEKINDLIARQVCVKMSQAGAAITSLDAGNDPALQKQMDELVKQQKAVQDEGGQDLRCYLKPYFELAVKHRAKEIEVQPCRTIPGGWSRFRSAMNWRD